MKIETKKLKDALNKLKHFTIRGDGKQGVSPCSMLVHFKNEGGKVMMFATDMANAARVRFDIEDQTDMDFCTKFANIEKAVRFKKNEIEMNMIESEGAIEFSDGKSKVKVAYEDAGSMGVMESLRFIPETAKSIEFKASDLVEMFSVAGIARDMKAKEQSIELTCVCFTTDFNTVCMKATDRKRISVWKSSENVIDDVEEGMAQSLVPPDVAEFPGYFDADSAVRVYPLEDGIIFADDNFEAYGHTVNKVFPKFGFLLKSKVIREYTVNAGQLMEAIDLIKDDSSREEDHKKVSFTFKADSISLSMKSNLFAADTDIPATVVNGDGSDEITAGFKQMFIIESISRMKNEDVKLSLLESNKPGKCSMSYQCGTGGYGLFAQLT